MTFGECLEICIGNIELVSEWERISGRSFPKTPIERMIDESTGHLDETMILFIEFVYDFVYTRAAK